MLFCIRLTDEPDVDLSNGSFQVESLETATEESRVVNIWLFVIAGSSLLTFN